MTLQEIMQSLDELSVDEQASLFNVLRQRLERLVEDAQEHQQTNAGNNFWQGVLRFRETIEQEGIEFTDADFADLRDRISGQHS